MCRENGGVWTVTQHGVRGCRCSDGKYLKNVYFEVCATSARRSVRKTLKPTKENKSAWAEKGQAWGISSQRRFLSTAEEVAREFVADVNRGDINSAMGLVNDYDVHPARELDGINRLLRQFSNIGFRDWDLILSRTHSSVAEPEKKRTGCVYFEEFTTTVIDNKNQSRGVGKMHIYCAYYSAENEGIYSQTDANRICHSYHPKRPQFKCKLGRIDMY